MNDEKNNEEEFMFFEIIQSGEIKKLLLNEVNLKKKFNELYYSLLKELKLNPKNAYLSNEEGRMVGNLDLNLTLEKIIEKFGDKLKFYYEKVF